MEMWKLTDATGVYVQPRTHRMRPYSLGMWRGLSLFADLDVSSKVDWIAVHELERHLGTEFTPAYKNVNNGDK